jgi:ABC-type lipoprotein release transport system permease subunit
MIENGARLFSGNLQLQHPAYEDDPSIEHTLRGLDQLLGDVEALPAVLAAAPRAQAFALASVGERSFGAQVLGVDPGREAAWSTLPHMQPQGRYLAGPGEAFVGAVLARNLGVGVGDELVLLGTARGGGVAAAVANIVGTFESGQAELDRSLVQIPIGDFRAGWNLAGDEAHVLVVMADSAAHSERLADRLAAPNRAALDWKDLMPEAEQTMELKRVGAQLFFVVIAVIVTFSVVNAFMMTVFERTREFGMLMAIGMRPGLIIAQLMVEALWLGVLGVALGLAAAGLIIGGLGVVGMPLPADAAEILARYNLPERMYPRFSADAAQTSALIMLVAVTLAALLPALRIRRMRPVEALRAAE